MNCPKCRVNLVIADRQGIEIDFCPQCRGVWLDRGELDKIIERANHYEARHGQSGRGDDDEVRHLDDRRGRSWWTELFD